MSHRFSRLSLALVFAFGVAACAAPLEAPGVSNFHQVDNHFYRGAQPSDDGFRSLARLGVKTVVDLRLTDARSLHEQQVVTSLGMHYVAIPMHGLGRPTDEELKQTFALLQDSQAWPVFVHCRRGADRTGTIAACYRISHDGW